MLIKLDVESDLYQRIEKLVQDRKYHDAIQFIKIAITNQLQEEEARDKTSMQYEEHESPEEISEKIRLHEFELEQELEELRSGLSTLTIEKSSMEKEDEYFIWSFYNRFFPVKIAIFQLANLMKERSWIDLNEWQESATLMAQGWYRYLKEYEIEHEIRMNEKLTVGLPTHPYELEKVNKRRKRERIKLEKKIASSKSRFMEQFVGRHNRKNDSFEGACFTMGLISAKTSGMSTLVSLTDLGREFALIKNPIIHEKKMTHSFSDDEIKFVYEKIISQFTAEQQIIKDVINELKDKSMTSDEIQKIFEQHKKFIFEYYSNEPEKLENKKKVEKITQTRVATMGRLSELKIVDWEIKERGISHYSLNQEKCQFLGII